MHFLACIYLRVLLDNIQRMLAVLAAPRVLAGAPLLVLELLGLLLLLLLLLLLAPLGCACICMCTVGCIAAAKAATQPRGGRSCRYLHHKEGKDTSATDIRQFGIPYAIQCYAKWQGYTEGKSSLL